MALRLRNVAVMVALSGQTLKPYRSGAILRSKALSAASSIRSSASVSAMVALALLVGLIGLPVWVLLRASMLQADGSVGFGNYIEAYSSMRQIHALWNTFVLGGAVCLATAFIAIPLAWVVSR